MQGKPLPPLLPLLAPAPKKNHLAGTMTYPERRGSGPEGCCEVLAVRHGLTDYNAERRLQGQLDVPLNDTGREQCRKCGAELQRMIRDGHNFTIDAVYSSPLQRARESAEIIREAAGIPCDIVVDNRIKEWNAGILQGHLLDEVSVRFPNEWAAWNKSRDPSYVFPEGESFQHRFDRVKDFFLQVAARHLGQRILVVTHGGVMDDLFRLVRKIPMNTLTNAPKVNAQIYVVRAHITPPKGSGCDGLSCLSSGSTATGSDGEDPQFTWEIVTWGKLTKTAQQVTGEAEHTPVNPPLRNIEYA